MFPVSTFSLVLLLERNLKLYAFFWAVELLLVLHALPWRRDRAVWESRPATEGILFTFWHWQCVAANPKVPPVKSWCYSLSLSFLLLLKRKLSMQLFWCFFCFVEFISCLLIERFFFLKYMGIQQQIRLWSEKNLACLIFFEMHPSVVLLLI